MEVSRSEQKRHMLQLEQLATALIALPKQVQEQLPCPEEIIREVCLASTMKGGARKRQVKYVTKMLHADGPQDELYNFIGRNQGKAIVAQRTQQQLELYRNALIEEALSRVKQRHKGTWSESWDSEVVLALKPSLPQIDEKKLLRLADRFAETRNPRYSREIFRTLKAALEQQKRMQGSK